MNTVLPEAAKAAIRGLPVEQAWRILGAGQQSGLWGWEALEAFHHRIAHVVEPPPRLPPKTRMARWSERPDTPSGCFVSKRSLDPTIDWEIPDGAYRCLDLIIARSGKTGFLKTFTSSLAKQLGRTSRTVQNYYRALIEAGYIERTFDRKTGEVTIRLTEKCRPPPYVPAPHERLYENARRSRDPRMKAALSHVYTLASGGAKFASALNPLYENKKAVDKSAGSCLRER